MSDVIRKIFSKLNRSVVENMTAKRHKFHVPIKISIETGLGTGKLSQKKERLSISGETADLSKTGLSFVLSAIRLREYYLVGEDRMLYAELDLPNGKIKMQLIGVRYEQINIHDSTTNFLIGAKILSMDKSESEIYEEYLRLGNKLKKDNLRGFSLETKS